MAKMSHINEKNEKNVQQEKNFIKKKGKYSSSTKSKSTVSVSLASFAFKDRLSKFPERHRELR